MDFQVFLDSFNEVPENATALHEWAAIELETIRAPGTARKWAQIDKELEMIGPKLLGWNPFQSEVTLHTLKSYGRLVCMNYQRLGIKVRAVGIRRRFQIVFAKQKEILDITVPRSFRLKALNVIKHLTKEFGLSTDVIDRKFCGVQETSLAVRYLVSNTAIECSDLAVMYGLIYIIALYHGVRPGSITVSKGYPDSETLLWKDVKFEQIKPGVWKITVKYNCLKNCHDKESRFLELSLDELKDPENLHLDPVIQFFAWGIRRDVFDGIHSSSDLANYKKKYLPVKKSKQNTPVFVKAVKVGRAPAKLTQNSALSSEALIKRRKGFARSIQRQFGDEIARELLGHEPRSKILERHYRGKRTDFKSSGVITGEDPKGVGDDSAHWAGSYHNVLSHYPYDVALTKLEKASMPKTTKYMKLKHKREEYRAGELEKRETVAGLEISGTRTKKLSWSAEVFQTIGFDEDPISMDDDGADVDALFKEPATGVTCTPEDRYGALETLINLKKIRELGVWTCQMNKRDGSKCGARLAISDASIASLWYKIFDICFPYSFKTLSRFEDHQWFQHDYAAPYKTKIPAHWKKEYGKIQADRRRVRDRAKKDFETKGQIAESKDGEITIDLDDDFIAPSNSEKPFPPQISQASKR
ncbi:hypothetical protein TWF970_000630 [Orbilia oligospora]|uniref:Uncharacterized protein n=1 Tax=Orbilia oligospora TaxID=2813651 RepID=A0A7C8VYB5_ORBOL|nr:hypothetical protein TWF970_000630 [Orbilia oligospora]